MDMEQGRASAFFLGGEILRYLKRYPGAMDSIEGIAEWWIMEARLIQTMEDITGVMSELVSRGVVEEIRTASNTLYRLKP